MPQRPNPRTVKIALVAYRDDGDVLQLVPLGTMSRPLPVARLIELLLEVAEDPAV